MKELDVQPKRNWFFDSIMDLTGQKDARIAGQKIADEEINKLLKLRGWKTFNGSVPILDFFSLHREIYPFFLYCELLDSKTQKGGVDLFDNTWKIKLRISEPVEEERFTVAHEVGHIIVRDHAKQQGCEDFALPRKDLPEENFCNAFARHFLLPDKIVVPLVKKAYSIGSRKEIHDLIRKFQVDGYMFRDWFLEIEDFEEGENFVDRNFVFSVTDRISSFSQSSRNLSSERKKERGEI